MSPELLTVPAPGTVQPAEIKKLDTRLSGRQYDTLTQEGFQVRYSQAVAHLEKERQALETEIKFRPSYAPGPTKSEYELKASVATAEERVRYYQLRFWLAKKGLSIQQFRGR